MKNAFFIAARWIASPALMATTLTYAASLVPQIDNPAGTTAAACAATALLGEGNEQSHQKKNQDDAPIERKRILSLAVVFGAASGAISSIAVQMATGNQYASNIAGGIIAYGVTRLAHRF